MFTSIRLVALVFLPLFSQAALAQGVEKAREDARQSYLKRFSQTEGAKTKTLGLSSQGRAYVDLFLDLQRNRMAARAGNAGGRRRMRSSAHHKLAVEGESLYLGAMFTNLVLDEVRVPVREIPELLEICSGKGSLAKVKVEGEDLEVLRGIRMSMLHYTYNSVQTYRRNQKKDGDWVKAENALRLLALASLDDLSPSMTMPTLDLLGRLGGESAAKKLIALFHAPPKGAQRYVGSSIVRALASIESPSSDAFLLEIYEGDNAQLRTAFLSMMSTIPGPKTKKAIVALLERAPERGNRDQKAALQALGRMQGQEGIELLLEVRATNKNKELDGELLHALVRAGHADTLKQVAKEFTSMKDGQAKLNLAQALANRGEKAVQSYLEGKLKQLQGANDGPSRFQASRIRSALRKLATLEKK
jgi:hypothetical protein